MGRFHKYTAKQVTGSGERGSLTIFVAVMILILMTLMVVYTSQVSVLETRDSGNEVSQKVAFQVAEAALDQGVMYLLANNAKILSSRVDVFPDGTEFTGDGWLASGALRWGTCTDTEVALANHPCGGDIPAPVGAYFYDDSTTDSGVDSLPVNESGFPTGATARMSALMCFVDLDDPGTGTCGSAPATAEDEAGSSLVITLLAYGYSDCTDTASPATCKGEATVAKPISNYKKLTGSPEVPLVTKSTFPPQGTAEIVGNPNGGGVGVPLSVWANNNSSCGPASAITSSGSWQTCEMEEWYHTNEPPADVACTDNNCICGPGGNDTRYFLSWKNSGDTNIGIDIVPDTNFPCDLFDTYFGVPSHLYQQIKSTATVLPDCSSLSTQSNGLIWISGSSCTLNAGVVVGSLNSPVILVSAAGLTTFNGGATVFGVVYIFDGEVSTAELKSTGRSTIYGAVIVDATIDKFVGNFQIVYSDAVITSASGIAGLGSINGGWRDFDLPAITW